MIFMIGDNWLTYYFTGSNYKKDAGCGKHLIGFIFWDPLHYVINNLNEGISLIQMNKMHKVKQTQWQDKCEISGVACMVPKHELYSQMSNLFSLK